MINIDSLNFEHYIVEIKLVLRNKNEYIFISTFVEHEIHKNTISGLDKSFIP